MEDAITVPSTVSGWTVAGVSLNELTIPFIAAAVTMVTFTIFAAACRAAVPHHPALGVLAGITAVLIAGAGTFVGVDAWESSQESSVGSVIATEVQQRYGVSTPDVIPVSGTSSAEFAATRDGESRVWTMRVVQGASVNGNTVFYVQVLAASASWWPAHQLLTGTDG